MPRSQFGAAHGVRGWVAAQVVSRLTAEANRWMVECLAVTPTDRVLDLGCGPGIGVALAAAAAPEGFVAGVDTSATMARQAVRRNRRAIGAGRVEVVHADAAAMPFPDGHFGKAWSLNSLQFWPEPETGLRELRRVVRPDGCIVIALMARSGDPAAATAPPPWLAGTARLMRVAGFDDLGFEQRDFGGVGHWALLGGPPGMAPIR